MSDKNNTAHSLILEQREKMSLSGVLEVVGFDEDTILLKTVVGSLMIKGEGLHIGSFSTESGDLNIDGQIIAFAYTDDGRSRGGFWRRLAR